MPTLSDRDYLLLRAYQAGITDSRELAAFMGQMEVESSRFGSMHERLGYRGQRLLDVFGDRNGIDTLEEANAIARGGPEAVANAVYGGRWGRNNLGNTEPGDGWRFHGRGYIQFTGRDNYERAARELGIDLVQNPDLAADREIAADIALNYWSNRVVARNHQFDVREATHDINGGYTHLPERTAAIARWEQALTPAVMEGLSRGEILLPAVLGHQNAMTDGILKSGEKGPEVRNLQESLVKLGITNAKGEALVPDGNYGQSTKEAVAKFQNQHWFHIGGAAGGAYVNGIANQETLKALQDRVNALDPLHGVRHAGDQFLPLGYRTDWLQTDAQGLPSYLRMNNAQNRTHTHEQIRTPALAPEHDYRAPPPAPRPLSTTETLQPGDRGAAVQALQQHLQLLGATDRYGQKIQDDRDYGERTREAVEQFQLWTGREPNGIADPDTLQAVQSQAQFALRQRTQGLVITSDAHLADQLRPIVPERVDAAIERPVQGRNQAGPPPHHDTDPHPGAHSTAMSAPSRSGPELKSEPESAQPQPHSPHGAQAFPTSHRDYALFEAIRQQLPEECSDDMAAHATLEARKGGISRPDQIRGMAIENGQLTIMGKSGVDFAFIELTASTPPLQETLQQSAAFDQQQTIQLAQFQEQQRQINQNQSGPTMRL